MQKHQQYDLWIHNDQELSELFGDEIIQRKTIHQWPNSCVEKITLKGEKEIIYKFQSGGIIESLFYEQASSPILPEARTLWRDEWYSCIAIEYINTPIFGTQGKSEKELLTISKELLNLISQIKGNLPILIDISTYAKWTEMAEGTLKSLRKLIAESRQYGSGVADIDYIEERIFSPNIKAVYKGKTGLIHGDLNGGNIFLQNGGLKLIDWQSYKLAPVVLDQAGFFSRQGINPQKYVSPAATCMLYFIGIWWLVQCQMTLIPEENYDEKISYFITLFKKVTGV